MSLNKHAYYTYPQKTKKNNRSVIVNSETKATKKPPVKKKNPNKTK